MEELRNYTDSKKQSIVENNYYKNHSEMTLELVENKQRELLKFDKGEFTIREILDKLDTLVDESDPDTNVGNNIHAFQTAERLRADFPHDDWLHLIGLIHDLGKILSLWGEPQHLVVGDTFVVGCRHSEEIVFHKFFENNPDVLDLRFNSIYGKYQPKCGLEKLTMSWGHDEYLYRVLKNAGTTLPSIALKIIRYHSFYAWHKYNAYQYFMTEDDNKKLLPFLKNFSKYDLYSKQDSIPDCETLWDNYYFDLCKKYKLDGVIKW